MARGLISIDSNKVAILRRWVQRQKINVDNNDGLVAVWNRAKELWPRMGELRLKDVVEASMKKREK